MQEGVKCAKSPQVKGAANTSQHPSSTKLPRERLYTLAMCCQNTRTIRNTHELEIINIRSQQAAMTRAAFLILTENAERASPHTGSLRTFANPPVRCDCESELKMEIPVEADKTVRQ